MKAIHKVSLPTVLLLSLIFSSPVHAFKYISCVNAANGQLMGQYQPFRTVNMYINQNNWSNTAYRNALNESINVINKSAANIGVNLYENGAEFTGNGYNEIFWSNDASHTPATTYNFVNSECKIIESDIVYWTGIPWTASKTESDLWQYGGPYRGFHNTTLHELGHVFGLWHENRRYNIMGSDWSHSHRSGGAIVPYMGADATNGLRAIYGNRSPLVQDVSLAEWEYKDAGGKNNEYSNHIRSRITDTQGNTRPTINPRLANGGAEPYYRVSRGGDYKVYLNFENNGATNQSVQAKYFIATSGGDINLSTITVPVNTGPSELRWASIKIPLNLYTNSYYWLGAKIDPNGYISESDEANNAWIGIYVEN